MASKGTRVKVSTPKRKVYVTHRAISDIEYKAAHEFGDIRYLSQNTENGKVNPFRDKNLAARFFGKLANSSPDDLLLLSGYGSIQTLASMVFLQIHGHVNVLIYNSRRKAYEIRNDFGAIKARRKANGKARHHKGR